MTHDKSKLTESEFKRANSVNFLIKNALIGNHSLLVFYPQRTIFAFLGFNSLTTNVFAAMLSEIIVYSKSDLLLVLQTSNDHLRSRDFPFGDFFINSKLH